MKTCNRGLEAETERFQSLVERGVLTAEELQAAGWRAAVRNVELERVLRYDCSIPRRKLVEALAEHYRCGWVEYDERLPVPRQLLEGLDAEKLCQTLWFPVAKDGETAVIAACDPSDPQVAAEVARFVRAEKYEFQAALAEDVAAFIQDFLNAPPDRIVGNERTGLALWRNNMARWRTKLACYRTDFASARTRLSFLRAGLTMITIGRMLVRQNERLAPPPLCYAMIAFGAFLLILGILSYHRIKRSIFRPPKHQTLVEVTAASLFFLDDYQFVEREGSDRSDKDTMLARLSDLVQCSAAVMEGSFDNKPRSELAHERNLLAAQRTVAACYRTIYSRARTGLSFIRTGASFTGIGLGLMEYYGLSGLNAVDGFIILAGVLMVADGTAWYWPVRKENYEALKCAVRF